ncbi:MAG: PDDEXK nuclease domain-containing protein [Acidobacteriia bacterium]|nr:PDDEXK nuclease domain-containing protein [Terriglobia bacterium]
MTRTLSHPDYPAFLAALKQRILHARTTAARAVNRALILLYWDIGRGIVEKQQAAGWGESVIDRLSSDLQDAFPLATGFSSRNLRDMKRFYLAYSDKEIWRQAVGKLPTSLSPDRTSIWPQAVANLEASDAAAEFLRQLVAEIPWGHHRLILDKLIAPAARLYYLRATAQLGWSRNVLLNDKERGPGDQPSIGIILCAEKDDVEVEFALKTKTNPIGVAEYQLQSRLPARFKGRLPTARQLEDAVRDVMPPEK